MSNIEWCDKTWNPILGCSKISAGCQNCYAIAQAYRNRAVAHSKPPSSRGRLTYYEHLTEKTEFGVDWTGSVVLVEEALTIPLIRKKPTRYFVNSMSDLFHEDVLDFWIDKILAVCALCPQHTFMVLTKRPGRMVQYFQRFNLEERIKESAPSGYGFIGKPTLPLSNVWLGVTVENQKTACDRIPLLMQVPATLRFLSCEPLLEEVKLPNCFLESNNRWVIAGGESGPKARFCSYDWLESIVNQCQSAEVPIFVKQLGSNSDCSISGKGADITKFPPVLSIRQVP